MVVAVVVGGRDMLPPSSLCLTPCVFLLRCLCSVSSSRSDLFTHSLYHIPSLGRSLPTPPSPLSPWLCLSTSHSLVLSLSLAVSLALFSSFALSLSTASLSCSFYLFPSLSSVSPVRCCLSLFLSFVHLSLVLLLLSPLPSPHHLLAVPLAPPLFTS